MATEKVKEVERKIKALMEKSITHEIKSVQYRHKKTGQVATQIPMMEIGDWERVGANKPRPKKPSPNAPFSAHIQYSIDKENWMRMRRFN